MKGTPRLFSASSRSGWMESIRIVARRPRIPAPTTPAAIRAPNRRALRALRVAGGETRRHLLVDEGNHLGHGLHAFGEHGENEVRAVRQCDARDEMVEVVGVARLRPHPAALRKTLPRQPRVLGLDVLERLV